MAKPHLRALEEALSRRGWRIVAVHPGDEYRVAAAWEIQRSGQASMFLDFDGMDSSGDFCLPLEESYGCQVRGRSARSLYFRRINKSRRLWQQELASFVFALDDEANAQSLDSKNFDPLRWFRARKDCWKDALA